MEQVFEWIRTLVLLVLVLTVTEHLLPSPRYKQYLKLYGGLLLVFVTVRFAVTLAGGGNWLEALAESAFQEADRQEQTRLKEQLKTERSALLLDTYRQEICAHVTQLLEEDGWTVRRVQLELTEEGLEGIQAQVAVNTSQSAGRVEEAGRKLSRIYELEESRVVVRLAQ